MRFLIDECTGPSVARWLREHGHDIFDVYEQARGMSDDDVIERAYVDDRILVTNDKDFGEKIYREKNLHKGVILLRLDDERAKNKIAVIRGLLENYSDRLRDNFIVATEQRVRIAGK